MVNSHQFFSLIFVIEIDFSGVTARLRLVSDDEDSDSNSENESDERLSSIDDYEKSMIEFFQSIQLYSQDIASSAKEEAIGIIIDRLNNDPDGSAGLDGVADIFSSRSKANVKKEMKAYLLRRIPQQKRQQRVGDELMKKWLKSPNSTRTLLFYSKNALVEIAATTTGLVVDSKASFDTLIESILDSAVAASPNNQQQGVQAGRPASNSATRNEVTFELIKSVLQRSFMRPLKGKQKEYCSMGHTLELPIAKDWMNDINVKKMLPSNLKFKVVSLHKVGLVGKKNSPWAKDSVDFIAFIYNEETYLVEVWGVEIKSRQTVVTVSKEKEHMRRLQRSKHERINASDVEKYVHSKDERWQLLHHAFVFGFERVALVIGNKNGKVISGRIIDYNEDLLNSYGNVIDELKNIALYWAYDTTSENVIIPNTVLDIADEIPTINGKESLYGALKLWKTMFDDTSILPRPTLQRILPATHAQWNCKKGGSDTVTKIVDDCFIKPPRQHTNFESVAVGRCISNLHAAVFKLFQICSSKSDINKYPSMQHYRNAAAQRISYKKYLRRCHAILKEEVEKGVSGITRQQNAEGQSISMNTNHDQENTHDPDLVQVSRRV